MVKLFYLRNFSTSFISNILLLSNLEKILKVSLLYFSTKSIKLRFSRLDQTTLSTLCSIYKTINVFCFCFLSVFIFFWFLVRFYETHCIVGSYTRENTSEVLKLLEKRHKSPQVFFLALWNSDDYFKHMVTHALGNHDILHRYG